MARSHGGLVFRGRWRWRVLDARGRVRRQGVTPNGATDQGLTNLLNGYFAGGGLSNWYAGLIDADGFDEVDDADTAATHAGWTEQTLYTSSTRLAWVPATTAGLVIANSSPMTFTFTAPVRLAGLLLASSNVKGGTGGVLWSTAPFDSTQVLGSGEPLQLSYEVEAAAGA